jgi:hypothetical protein
VIRRTALSVFGLRGWPFAAVVVGTATSVAAIVVAASADVPVAARDLLFQGGSLALGVGVTVTVIESILSRRRLNEWSSVLAESEQTARRRIERIALHYYRLLAPPGDAIPSALVHDNTNVALRLLIAYMDDPAIDRAGRDPRQAEELLRRSRPDLDWLLDVLTARGAEFGDRELVARLLRLAAPVRHWERAQAFIGLDPTAATRTWECAREVLFECEAFLMERDDWDPFGPAPRRRVPWVVDRDGVAHFGAVGGWHKDIEGAPFIDALALGVLDPEGGDVRPYWGDDSVSRCAVARAWHARATR